MTPPSARPHPWPHRPVRVSAAAGLALCLLHLACLSGLPAPAIARNEPPARAPGTAAAGDAVDGTAGGRIDTDRTRIGFTLKTRWGQTLRGHFPEYAGSIESLADGKHQVRLRLSARTVSIDDHANYTRFMRGEGFFDAERYPEVRFVSRPYDPALLRAGGKLAGTLHIRDTRREETFVIAPSACERPGHDCDVVAVGSVRRSDYGVDRWMFAVSDQVRFTLHLRLAGGTAGEAP